MKNLETTLCFLNDKISVLKGTQKSKGIFVKAYDSFKLREGSVINGVITDSYNVSDVLSEIKNDRKLFGKNVSVIIDSSLIHTKLAVVPLMNEEKLIGAVKNEFSGIETLGDDYFFDYTVISPKNAENNGTILCYAIQKNMIKNYIELFGGLKIKLKSIDTALNCVIKYTRSIRELTNKSYIILNVNSSNISSFLFVNGRYYYSSRARLLNEFGTEEYFSELVSHISSIIQFNKSQRNGSEVNEIYISGLDERQISILNGILNELNLTLLSLNIFKSNIITGRNIRMTNTGEYIYNIGALTERGL